jgi:hypothetical protein
MRVMGDYHTINAEDQMKVQDESQLSVWQFWQSVLLHRKKHKEVFVYATSKRSHLKTQASSPMEGRVRVVRNGWRF